MGAGRAGNRENSVDSSNYFSAKHSKYSSVGTKKEVLKEVLIVYNEPPVQTHGGNIRVYNLIKEATNKANDKCNITLLFIPKCKKDGNIEKIRKEFPSVKVVVGKTSFFDLFKLSMTEKIDWVWNRYFILKLKKLFSRQSDLIKNHWQQTYCLRREIKNMLKNKDFDIIQVEHLYLADCIKNVKISTRTKKILDLHNVHSAMVLGDEKKKMESAEREIAKYFDSTLVCSEKEKNYAEHSGFRNVKVVPNGVDIDYFKFEKNNSTKKLLFVADLSYLANREGVLWFIKKMKPFIPQEMKVEIIGDISKNSRFLKYSDVQIKFYGFVDDFRAHVKDSIFICPIKYGGGTRLKLLMAAATGMPIITTSKGAEGLDFKNNRDVLIADNPYEFIMALDRLVKDNKKEAKEAGEKLGDKLRHNARKIVEDKYSWKIIGKIYLGELLDEKSSSKNKIK